MADEHSHLIQNAQKSQSKRTSSLYFEKIYQDSCVHSKGATIVLIWSGVITISSLMLFYYPTKQLFAVSKWSYIPQHLVLFLYPILGYLGEKWRRYKVIKAGVSIIVGSYVVHLIIITIAVTLEVGHEIKIIIQYLHIITSTSAVFGLGLFIGNIIQFGTNQIQFAPSQYLAAFARWFVCVYLFCWALPGMFQSAGTVLESKLIYYGIYCITFALLIGFTITFACCCKQHFTIEPPTHIDPVKMIWRVMKYAWKHKYPVRRSAFTYNENPPTRLDLAKERYGGPFTTEQVEDVKSFWNILAVLLSLTASTLSNTIGVGELYVKALGKNTTLTFIESTILRSSLTLPCFVVFTGIIIFQLVIVPFFSSCIPTMLKRMWIGHMFVLLSTIMLIVISAQVDRSLQNANHTSFCGEHYHTSNITISTGLWPYYVLIIPQLLSGFGFLLSTMTSLEFILAQSPHYMQSTLIGLLFLQTAVSGLNGVIGISTPVGCYWEYYAVICGIVFISLIIYSIVAYQYKYRQRNEISDINVRVTIEEIYERNLEREAREQDEDDKDY